MPLGRIIEKMEDLDYRIFKSVAPFNLNIVGVRSANRQAGKFDDEIHVFHWKEVEDRWVHRSWPATTDPSDFYLAYPMNRKGCAILKPGQYRGSHIIGKHRGKYSALVQIGNPVSVYRDTNRDAMLDYDEDSVETGWYGINIHRAHPEVVLEDVHKYSAGCQVFQDPDDFDDFMWLCHKSAELFGNRFTYTLLQE